METSKTGAVKGFHGSTPSDSRISEESPVQLNRLYAEDCVQLMKRMRSECVDLTVTSPPYDDVRSYKGYVLNFEDVARGLLKVTKTGGVVVWVVGDKIHDGDFTLTSFRQALFFQQVGFKVHDRMIYEKKCTRFARSTAYTNCYEFMFVLVKGRIKTFNPIKVPLTSHKVGYRPSSVKPDGSCQKKWVVPRIDKKRTNIWEYATGLHGTTNDKIAFKHPAVFPERLAADHILSWSNKGDLVFDPMCGSGTTCKMAKMLGRNYIGCDISKEYVQIAQQRVDSIVFQKELAEFPSTTLSRPRPRTDARGK